MLALPRHRLTWPALPNPWISVSSHIAQFRAAWNAARQEEASARTLLDELAPEWVENLPDAYAVGNDGAEWHTRSYVVREHPATVAAGALSRVLFDLGGDVDVAVAYHTHRLGKPEALRRLRTQRTVQTSVVQARAQRGALSDPAEQQGLGDATLLQERVQRDAESLFSVEVSFTLRAATPEALDAADVLLRDRMAGIGYRLGGMRWQHAGGFLAAAVPYAAAGLGRAVTLDTTTLALGCPFLTADIGTSSGPLWGVTLADRAPLRYDPYAAAEGIPAPHVALIGPTGAGKTTCFLTVLCEYLAQADPPDAVLIDNKGDLRRFCADLGGQRVAFSSAPAQTINIMDLPPPLPANDDGTAGENPVIEAAFNIAGFLHLACGQRTPLLEEELALAEKAALQAYASTAGGRLPILRDDPTTWRNPAPTLAALVDELRAVGAPSLANRLEPYATGALAALFGQPTTLDLSASLVVFDLAELRTSLRALVAYLIGTYTWRRARTRPGRLIFGMDDVVRLLAHETTARLVADIYALGRSFGVSAWTMAQSALDYSGTLEGQRVLENCHTTFTVSSERVGEGILATPRGSERVRVLPCETVLGWLPVPHDAVGSTLG